MHKFYYENNKKNAKKEYENVKFHSELTSLTSDVGAPNFRETEKI